MAEDLDTVDNLPDYPGKNIVGMAEDLDTVDNFPDYPGKNNNVYLVLPGTP